MICCYLHGERCEEGQEPCCERCPDDPLRPVVDGDELNRCDMCGAVCDMRIQVCECEPECPYPPVVR